MKIWKLTNTTFELFKPCKENNRDKTKTAGPGNWFGVRDLHILFLKQLETIIELYRNPGF